MAFNNIIIEKDGSYWIKKKLKGKYYHWGPFNTFQKAENKCVALDNDGWPHKKTKPQYEDFYNPPSINNNEITDISKYNDLILIQISVKLNKSINKSYVKLVYHDYAYSFGFFNDKEEAEQFILKFLINGSIAKQTILSLLKYESVNDFKEDMKIDVSYDKSEDQYIVKRVNNDNILTLGSYYAENQAENVKKSYLKNLNKISCFKSLNKNQFIHFSDEKIPYYKNIRIISPNKIITNGTKFPLKFNEFIKFIDDFNKSHFNIQALSDKYKVSKDLVKKIIFNYESNKFEDLLKEYNEKLQSIDFDDFASELINIGNDEDSNNKNTRLSNDVKSYTNLSLKNNGKVFAGNNPLKIKVYEIEDLYNSFKRGRSLRNLSKYYGIQEYLIRKIIYTYQNGNFDGIINEWNNEFKYEESIYSQKPFEDSIRNRLAIFDESSNQPYKNIMVNKYGDLEAENRNLGFTIFDARNIHEDYNTGEEIKDIVKKHKFAENKINRIILRYDAGDFHKVLKKILKNNPSNEHNAIKIKNNIPFTKLEIDTNGNILIHSSNSNQNISLGLKIKDINLLFDEYKNNRSIKSLGKHFNMSYASTERIINRIIAGDFKEIIKLNPNLKLDEDKNNSQSTKSKDKFLECQEKNNSSNYFADEVTEYNSDLILKNKGKVFAGNNPLKIKVYEIEDILDSFKKGIAIEKLSKQFNVSEYIIKKTIYNYKLGKFDDVISEWKYGKKSVEPVKIKNGFKDPIRERIILSKSQNKPYKILKISTYGLLKGPYHELKFTILDARDIHESYNEGQSIENLAIKYNFSDLTILRIIGRYDAGDFDKFLEEVLIKNLSNKDSDLKIKNNLPFNLRMDAEGNIYNILSNGQYDSIGLKLEDIKLISKEYGNNRSIKSLSNHFNMNYDFMERVINRIIVEDFKKIPLIKKESLNKIPNSNLDTNSSEVKEKTGKLNEINEKINFILNHYDNILEEKSKNTVITKKSKSEELNKKPSKFNNQKDIVPNLNNETIYKSQKSLIKIKDEKPIEALTLNNNEESEVSINNYKEINELKDRIEKLSISNKERADVIDHLILENQQNSSVYTQKIKDLNNSLEDFDHLTIKVNMLEEENLNLKTNNTEKSHEIEGLIKEKNEYLLERTKTNNDLNNSLAKYNQLNSEVKDLKSKISTLKDINIEKSNQIDDLIIKNKKSSEEYYQKISNLNDSLTNYGQIKSENEDLKQINKTKTEKLNKLVVTNKKSEQKYTQKIENLKSSIINQEQINDLKSEINILKSENDNLKTFNKTKSQELEQEKNKIKKINNELQNNETEYNKYKSGFNNKINDLKKFNSELLTENEKLKFELNSKPKDRLTSEIESLKLQIQDMENVYNRNIELNNEIYDLKRGQTSLINLNNDSNSLKDQLSKVKLELIELKKSNQQLIDENEKLKSVNNVEGQNKNNFESKNNTKNDKKNLSKDLEKVDDFIYKFINGKIEKIKK